MSSLRQPRSSPRTVLCVPGHREDWIVSARESGADLILWDLEDAVPADKKWQARELVAAHIQPGDAVRVNAFDSEWFDDDLKALARFTGQVWVPKVEDVTPLAVVYEKRRIANQVALIETPRGVLRGVRELESFPNLFQGLAWGLHDFVAASCHLSYRDTIAIDYAVAQVTLLAMANRIPCIAAPEYSDNLDSVREAAALAKMQGFTGMGCLSPQQVRPVRAAFTWSTNDIAKAQRIVDAAPFLPGATGRTNHGDLVSPPTLAWAQNLLEEVLRG